MSFDAALTSPAAQRILERAPGALHTILDDLGDVVRDQAGAAEMTIKADGTPVTSADLLVDERFHAALQKVFPNHGIVSEERDTVVPGTEWTWIIDPIDGTSNFTASLPYWCTSIALAFQGQPVVGMIDAPPIRRRYVAVRGHGATVNRVPIQVMTPIDWTDAAFRHVPIMLTMATARHARAAGVRCNVRNMGSAALDVAMVADGTAVASIERVPHVWDVAAGQVLVTEAGGVMIQPSGHDLFPLEPGVDQRDVAALTISAVDLATATGLAETLVHRVAAS